ncbi:MAG: nucleotidyltransferase family protein [Nanoarchaeota archaeon]|nr:nucleotidyltransferase family protein [Nanoarchaeota archaeon]
MDKAMEFEIIKKSIIPILKKHKVKRAGIFGSYARGEQNKKSDVDILIDIENGDLIDLIRLKNRLEKAINKKVDLVEYAGIKKQLKKTILKDEITINL